MISEEHWRESDGGPKIILKVKTMVRPISE